MTYILLIILTLDANQNSKDIELRIPYENKEECLKASKKLDFSFKFPGKNITTKSECILKENNNSDKNIET
tara:strand:- start:450 stop:662 length:213 start_codon:yes stop_codon:yes gene_type:complete